LGGMGKNDEAVTQADVLWLGLSAAVMGSLVGGLMLGIGMAMVIERVMVGLVLIVPGVPIAGGIGYFMARRLAKRFPR